MPAFRVSMIPLTHKHEDHVSGLIAPDGSEAFTKLERVWIGAGDTRDRVVPVSESVAINDWVTAIPTPGHTPGHTVYDVRSGTGHLLAWGDTVHVPTLPFDQPKVSWELDGDQSQARTARAALLERLTQPHHFVAGAHLDSPGIVRVTPSGGGYALEYLAPPIG
ncbi:MBL fold metallo-hydrolase [Nonomuraea sp. NPDC059007]|uniref:MBL fold metallo-hydrolase n=1 Tax=Nonomuraea sp. NPDC059007 TaxID=3346692 RepID=UPI00368D317F